MKYPNPHWPDEKEGIYSRGYFQKFVLAALWERVHVFSTMPEIKDPLEAAITETQLGNSFPGLEDSAICAKLRQMEKQGHIRLQRDCHMWSLGPRQLERMREVDPPSEMMRRICGATP